MPLRPLSFTHPRLSQLLMASPLEHTVAFQDPNESGLLLALPQTPLLLAMALLQASYCSVSEHLLPIVAYLLTLQLPIIINHIVSMSISSAHLATTGNSTSATAPLSLCQL